MNNKIRLSDYPNYGVKTEINGVEMQDVVDIHLTCPVDGVVELSLIQLVGPGLDVTVNGKIEPTVICDDDRLELHIEHPTPDTTRYWVTRR